MLSSIDPSTGGGDCGPNLCAAKNGGCDTLTSCTLAFGGRQCGECPYPMYRTTFSGDGASVCVDVDECNTKPCWQARSQLPSYNVLLPRYNHDKNDSVTAVYHHGMATCSPGRRRLSASTRLAPTPAARARRASSIDARARGAEPEPSSIPHGGSSPSRGGLGATLREFRVGLRELPAAFFCLSAMLALGSPLFACFETFAPAVRYKLYISVQTRFGSEPKAELFANQPD